MTKALALVLVLVLACDGKMSADRCVSVMSRIGACADPSVKTAPADATGSALLLDRCQDERFRETAAEAAACLDKTSSCDELRACFRP